MGLKHVGSHLLVDAWGAPADVLDSRERIKEALEAAVCAGGVTLIDMCVHQFSPYGVTATATLAESHATIHTWPEHGYFSADFFFCGSGDPYKALDALRTALQAKRVRLQSVKRGFDVPVVEADRLLADGG